MADSERSRSEATGGAEDGLCADYDWETTPPSVAVVETVADATDREPEDVGPLYGSVDPDALDALVAPDSGDGDNDVRVSFEFGGRHVTIHSSGTVTVRPAG